MSLIARQTRLWLNVVLMVGCLSVWMLLIIGVKTFSNTNVDQDFIANIDIMKTKVAQDSMNMYKLAEESLAKHPGLKKVIILKRIFRCDNPAKESLSQYANSVYDEIWTKKGRPSNIHIADQKLQCDGNLRSLRYGYQQYDNYDGVHMRGKLSTQHYTRSIIDVFTSVYPQLLNPNTAQSTQTQHNNNTTYSQSGNF